jgi:hypothetical protein
MAGDDLRDRLRALGYLNAPVDRFVLGAAAGRRSAVALAAGASARIGILAGVLLGPVAAAGLATKLPELITGVTDSLVVAAYLAAMFGLAAAIASFAMILLASALARSLATRPKFSARAQRVARLAGAVIFLACLAYLTLWWRAAVSTSSAPTMWSSAAALGVALVISVVLGHAVTVTALALVAHWVPARPDEATIPVRPSLFGRPALTLPLTAIAVIGAGLLLFAATPQDGAAASPPPPIHIVPTGERLLVIAIDGVDLAMLDRLRASSTLPNLSRLLSGATATLAPDSDRDPARVWTTIATGQVPERHGIGSLEARQVAGVGGRVQTASRIGTLIAGATDLVRLTRPVIASGNERRSPTFWEVAARTGLRSAVIHWWATWPAPAGVDDAGVVLSDRALLRLEQGGSIDAEIAPAGFYETLQREAAARKARVAALAAGVVPAGTPADVAALIERSALLDAAIADLATNAAIAAPTLAAGWGPLDLETIYLPGLDIAQHGLLAQGSGPAAATSVVAARIAAVEAYYGFLDRLIGTLDRGDRTVLLVTQPGRVSTPGPGLMALSGRAARADAAQAPRTDAPATAIAPTVLYALGLPVASDLASPFARQLFSDAFLAAHAARNIDSYGPRRFTPRVTTGKPLDQEMIERMRSLGYVR